MPNDPDIPIPVAFSPPKIPVAEAGLLIDGQVDARETAATIIDLAVRGRSRCRAIDEDDFQVTLVDPEQGDGPARDGASDQPVRRRAARGGEGSFRAGAAWSARTSEMRDSVRNQVASRGWFRKVPSAAATGSFGFGIIAIAIFAAFAVGFWLLLILIPLLPIVITFAVIRAKLEARAAHRRRPSGVRPGRGLQDLSRHRRGRPAQVRGGRGHLLRSTCRGRSSSSWPTGWAKICGDLVRDGPAAERDAVLVHRQLSDGCLQHRILTSSLTSAAMPVASSSGASGTGFGGGSSFGGGGFSGGGGGGGGSSGSW